MHACWGILDTNIYLLIGSPAPGVPPKSIRNKNDEKISHTTTRTMKGGKMISVCTLWLVLRAINIILRFCLPGDEAHEGAIRIFGVIRVLSERRRLGKAALATRK